MSDNPSRFNFLRTEGDSVQTFGAPDTAAVTEKLESGILHGAATLRQTRTSNTKYFSNSSIPTPTSNLSQTKQSITKMEWECTEGPITQAQDKEDGESSMQPSTHSGTAVSCNRPQHEIVSFSGTSESRTFSRLNTNASRITDFDSRATSLSNMSDKNDCTVDRGAPTMISKHSDSTPVSPLSAGVSGTNPSLLSGETGTAIRGDTRRQPIHCSYHSNHDRPIPEVQMKDMTSAIMSTLPSLSHSISTSTHDKNETEVTSSGKGEVRSNFAGNDSIQFKMRKRQLSVLSAGTNSSSESSNENESMTRCGTGSGCDGGYAASASSNDPARSSNSSPSLSSSEERTDTAEKTLGATFDGQSSSSSELDSFSSENYSGSSDFSFNMRSSSPRFSSSSNSSSDEPEEGYERANKKSRTRKSRGNKSENRTSAVTLKKSSGSDSSFSSNNSNEGEMIVNQMALKSGIRILERSFKRKMVNHQVVLKRHSAAKNAESLCQKLPVKNTFPSESVAKIFETAPIYSAGCDMMANCMSYLEPPEVLTMLTTPFSKTWRALFTNPDDLWKVLCLSNPFEAKLEAEDMNSDDSLSCFSTHSHTELKHIFGRYRLLYTSFVRCMRYLDRIRDDALNGRPPTAMEELPPPGSKFHSNLPSSLGAFLAKAKKSLEKNRAEAQKAERKSDDDEGGGVEQINPPLQRNDVPVSVSSDGNSSSASPIKTKKKKSKSNHSSTKKCKPRFGHSKITERLLGPSKKNGEVGHVELPWSCAIYSVVNWMVAFADVLGIQIMCLKVLPVLLEDERQRTTAQLAGLTDIVLRGMVLFPGSSELHTSAFHTLVLLARPLGGKEGMLFHRTMVNSSGILNMGSGNATNGTAVMMDSMRRFSSNEVLQAMSCWSMVNIALVPSQKAMLVKLGGISVTANAMMMHPFSAEVQFRALFALINLVIPCGSLPENAEASQEQLGDMNNTSEREMLDENVGQIANLVVVAMKNFCSAEAILNRACLVLHNLSLNQDYHTTLLWTPNCYQMLEWSMGNYPLDRVIQQSAGGTLQRLQMTMANDDDLRMRFAASIRAQQLDSLERARREAFAMHDQIAGIPQLQQLSNAD